MSILGAWTSPCNWYRAPVKFQASTNINQEERVYTQTEKPLEESRKAIKMNLVDGHIKFWMEKARKKF